MRPVPDLSIRKAQESDLPSVMALVEACVADMGRRGIDQWDEHYPTLDRFESDLSTGSLHVATAGDGVVGVFTVDGNQDIEYEAVTWTILDGPIAVVHRLMVHPAYQGRGIARRFMVFAERLASELGFVVMRLDAFSANPQALQLYRGLGYDEVGDVAFFGRIFRCFEKRLSHGI
jgi:GNAT superfamily N-acetyltransferase